MHKLLIIIIIFISVLLIYKLAPPHGGASLLINTFKYYPIFHKNIEIINITAHLSIIFII